MKNKAECKVENCSNNSRTKGLCRRHWEGYVDYNKRSWVKWIEKGAKESAPSKHSVGNLE